MQVAAASIPVVDASQLALPSGGSPCFERLNRLAWRSGFSVSCYGTNISVRTNVPRYLESLCDLLPPSGTPCRDEVVDVMISLWAPAAHLARDDRTRRFTLLYVNDALVARDLDPDAVLRSFERQVQLGVAASCPDRVFVHAGVVGWQGTAILLPGASGRGKSELVRALLRRGATLYSDEYAVIGPDADVEPFARALALRSRSTGKRTRVAPSAIGARVATGPPIAVGLVLFTRYEAGARWNPRRLSPAEVTVGLIENAVAARIAPERVLECVSRVARAAPGLTTCRGDARGAARQVLRALEATSAQPVYV